jgi:hypothetical protein
VSSLTESLTDQDSIEYDYVQRDRDSALFPKVKEEKLKTIDSKRLSKSNSTNVGGHETLRLDVKKGMNRVDSEDSPIGNFGKEEEAP